MTKLLNNQVILSGFVGNDPDVYTTDTGNRFIKANIAVQHQVKGKDDNWSSEADWFPIVIFHPLSESAFKIIRKGTGLTILGQLKSRKWQDSNGDKHSVCEIVVKEFQIFKQASTKNTDEKRQGAVKKHGSVVINNAKPQHVSECCDTLQEKLNQRGGTNHVQQ